MYDASMHLDGIVNRVVIMIVLWKPDGQRQPTSERKKELQQIQVVLFPHPIVHSARDKPAMRRNGLHGKTNYPITRIAFDNMKVLVHHRVCQRAEQSAETLSLNEQPSIPSASHNPPLLEHLYIPLTCERARIGTLRLFYVFPRVVFRGVCTDLAGLP